MNEIAIQENPTMIQIAQSPRDIIAQAQEQAQELMDVVEQQKLYQIIRGKKFLNVEAWQLVGAFSGLTAVPEWTKEMDSDDDIIRKARVVIYNREGKEVSAGEAECRRSEDGKNWMSPNQILSTAQTRAESKAYRLKLSFIARLAGYEPTPAEEIDENGFHEKETPAPASKQTATPKSAQAPEKVAKAEPKTNKLVGISKDEFNEIKNDCLRYVAEEIFEQIGEDLGLKGKKLSQLTHVELADLLQTCKNFQEEQAKQTEEEEQIKPFPVGEEGKEDAESEDDSGTPF